jgi:hypothetical protein
LTLQNRSSPSGFVPLAERTSTATTEPSVEERGGRERYLGRTELGRVHAQSEEGV